MAVVRDATNDDNDNLTANDRLRSFDECALKASCNML